jgi:SAM-dependent methyltransferase
LPHDIPEWEDGALCYPACIDFARNHLSRAEVQGKHVIEIGAMNVNGSIRQSVVALGPASYIGTDIAMGRGVDEVCDVSDLGERYGRNRFDAVICTEVLEHVRDWRGAVSNVKRVLRPYGVPLVTTWSKGFRCHGYPFDFWRFELSDFELTFGNMETESLQPDPEMSGVFLKARKAAGFSPKDLGAFGLYSIVNRKRCREIGTLEIVGMRLRHRSRAALSCVVPEGMKVALRKVYPGISKMWRD